MTTTRSKLLREAESLVTGDRNNQYGPPSQDFTRTAEALNALGYRGPNGRDLRAHDVAVILGMVKFSRITWSPEKWDSWVDLAGYAACGAECVIEEQVTYDPAEDFDPVESRAAEALHSGLSVEEMESRANRGYYPKPFRATYVEPEDERLATAVQEIIESDSWARYGNHYGGSVTTETDEGPGPKGWGPAAEKTPGGTWIYHLPKKTVRQDREITSGGTVIFHHRPPMGSVLRPDDDDYAEKVRDAVQRALVRHTAED